MGKGKYRWATAGDINAFFALFLDNVVNLFILAAILTGYGLPKEFIYTRIIPGTAAGILFGDLAFTWLAFRLARKTGRDDVTAMPLGLDLPTTIGVAIAIMGPAYLLAEYETGDAEYAARLSWYIGMGTTLWMGIIKLVGSVIGPLVQRIVPSAGLVGSLAGIGLVWLGAHALFGIYEVSFVGLVSLVIILFTLVARFQFPLNIPGAAAAVIVGSLVYYAAGATGILETIGVPFEIPGLEGIGPQPAYPRSEAFREFLGETLNYLPVAVPFSILVITGAINVTEAARLAGDDFNPREILITDAVATLIAGVCGGVAQSAPYFGHSAYKRMGARCAYTLATALAVGFGGMFGLIGYLVDLVPAAVVKPILILIGFDIVRLAFQMTPRRHIMGVILAMTPTVINYCYINLKTLYIHVQDGSRNLIAEVKSMGGIESGAAEKLILQIENIVPAPWLDEHLRFGALGQGFIITAVIWGATAAFVIDRQIARASVAMFIASVFSLFGVIHSVFPNSRLYLPWNLEVVAGNSLFERSLTIPYEYSAAYLLAGITLLGMYFLGPARRGRGPAQDLE